MLKKDDLIELLDDLKELDDFENFENAINDAWNKWVIHPDEMWMTPQWLEYDWLRINLPTLATYMKHHGVVPTRKKT